MKDFSLLAEQGIDTDSDNINYLNTKWSPQSETYAKKHPNKNLSINLTKKKEEDCKNGEMEEENHDEEISMLFQDAIVKLEKIEDNAKQQKKQIVVELAKNLEGKIPTDTICMEIVTQLRGKVSERFVRECLDEKYKQIPRMENARKQKKINYEEDKEEVTEELAAVAPLNQQSENDKIMLVEASGQSLVHKDGDSDDKRFHDTNYDGYSNEDNTAFSKLLNQKDHEHQSGPKDEPVDLSECPSCRELYYENIELKEIIENKINLQLQTI